MGIQQPQRLPVYFVSREQWGALPPTSTEPMVHPVETVIYTYNLMVDKCLTREACAATLKDMQRRAIEEQGLSDIPYNFLIGDDGNVYEGRGWYAQPSNSLPYPEYKGNRLDIAFIGNYTDNDSMDLLRPGLYLMHHGIANRFLDPEWDWKEIPPLPEGPETLTQKNKMEIGFKLSKGAQDTTPPQTESDPLHV